MEPLKFERRSTDVELALIEQKLETLENVVNSIIHENKEINKDLGAIKESISGINNILTGQQKFFSGAVWLAMGMLGIVNVVISYFKQ